MGEGRLCLAYNTRTELISPALGHCCSWDLGLLCAQCGRTGPGLMDCLLPGGSKLGPGTYACINLGSTVSSNSMLYSMNTFAEKTVRRQGSAPLEGGEGRVNAGSHFPAYRLTDSGGNRTSTSKCLTRSQSKRTNSRASSRPNCQVYNTM